MHGLLITALESGGADKPHARTGTALTLEHAFFFELCNRALGAPLRAPKILRELSDGRLRVIPKESERAGSSHILRAQRLRIRQNRFSDRLEHELHKTLARTGRARAGQGLVIVCLPPPDRGLNGQPRQHRTPPRQEQSLPETSRPPISIREGMTEFELEVEDTRGEQRVHTRRAQPLEEASHDLGDVGRRSPRMDESFPVEHADIARPKAPSVGDEATHHHTVNAQQILQQMRIEFRN